MAQYTITFKEDNTINHKLNFMGLEFELNMLESEYGMESDKEALEYQVQEVLLDIDEEIREEILEAIAEMHIGEDEIQEVIGILTQYELQNEYKHKEDLKN